MKLVQISSSKETCLVCSSFFFVFCCCSKTSKWTLPYEDHLGLNTILTVSRPFFDTYSFSTGNTNHEGKIQVAGVAGVDVLYSDVQKALDTSQVLMLCFFQPN